MCLINWVRRVFFFFSIFRKMIHNKNTWIFITVTIYWFCVFRNVKKYRRSCRRRTPTVLIPIYYINKYHGAPTISWNKLRQKQLKAHFSHWILAQYDWSQSDRNSLKCCIFLFIVRVLRLDLCSSALSLLII